MEAPDHTLWEGLAYFELREAVSVRAQREHMIRHLFEHAYLVGCNRAFRRIFTGATAVPAEGLPLDALSTPVPEDVVREFVGGGFELTEWAKTVVSESGRRRFLRVAGVGVVPREKLIGAVCSVRAVEASGSGERENGPPEEERVRRSIYRELHDGVGQMLTGIQMLSGEARSSVPEDYSRARRYMERIRTLACDAMDRIESLQVDRGGQHDRTLGRMLERTARRVNELPGITCRAVVDEEADVVGDKARQLSLIAEEAVHNAVRHAEPQEVEVALGREEGALVLRVRDDGKGMAETGSSERGTAHMRDRAAEIGARLRFESEPGAGTIVTCTLEDSNVRVHASE